MITDLLNSNLRHQVNHAYLRFFILFSLMTFYYISHGFLISNIGIDLNSLSATVL